MDTRRLQKMWLTASAGTAAKITLESSNRQMRFMDMVNLALIST
jgi:hypothetical protein